MQITKRRLSELVPYENNPRHNEKAIEAVAASIKQCGYVAPIIVDEQGVILAGHTRRAALLSLYGPNHEAEIVIRAGLTDDQKRKYRILDNKTNEFASWDFEALEQELEDLSFDDFDFGFGDLGNLEKTRAEQFFADRDAWDAERQQDDEYDGWLDKFEEKHTTDDCYTPEKVYDAVARYVAKRYKLDAADFVRPFYPGGDYQAYKYGPKAVVVDNPPFSILSEIVRYYCAQEIPFFLFSPGLTPFSSAVCEQATAICVCAAITYANGAVVGTSFITNLEPGIRCRSDGELYEVIAEADRETQAETKREIPKYQYPPEVISAAMVKQYSRYGIDFAVTVEDSAPIRALEEQKEYGKAIFGGGFLLSESATAAHVAAERAAAERAAAERDSATQWELSEKEKGIIAKLGRG